MRIITNIFLLFFSIAVVACNNGSEDAVNEVSLTGKRIQIPNEHKDKYPMILINDVLISKMYIGYVSTLTPEKWYGLDTLFHLGNGHNEFQGPTLSKGTDKSLMLIDQPNIGNKLTSLTVITETDSIEAIKDASKWQKYDLLKLPPLRCTGRSFVSLPNNSILVVGTPFDNRKHLFSIIDYKKQEVTPLNYWPEDDVKCTDMVKHAVYADNSRLYGNGKNRFLYQCEWSRFAFVFSIEGKKVNVIKELFSDRPNYKSDERGLNFVFEPGTMSTETIYSTVCSDRIYFLLLDSDRNGNKLKKSESPAIYGNKIVEYDWDGNKQRIIHLDNYGQKILLSDDNKTLYLLTDDYYDNRVPGIWSYDLSSIK